MTIQLTDRQIKVLQTRVEAGEFLTVEEALDAAIMGRSELSDDLEWVKPYLDDADAADAANPPRPAAEVFAELEAKLLRAQRQ